MRREVAGGAQAVAGLFWKLWVTSVKITNCSYKQIYEATVIEKHWQKHSYLQN